MAALLRLANSAINDQLTLKPRPWKGEQGFVSLKILRYKQLPSTNTTAYRLAEQSAPEWTIIVADQQTRGRGRGGKKWESPKGGLWFSILLRPDVRSSRAPLLQYLTANAARQAVQDETGLQVQLKWPNDLVIDKNKLGGILIESKTLGDRVSFAILGIGLNVNQGEDRLPGGATSIRLASGMRYDQRRLLKAIVDQTRSRYDELDEPSTIMDEWWRNCVHRPPRVQVALPKGIVIGITRGIDEDGGLIIETDDRRVQRVREGTLRLFTD